MTLIIAVSYGGSSDIPAYIKSLQDQDAPDWQLAIVNNSADPLEARSLQMFAELDRRVSVLEVGSNLGYLGAVRWALRRLDWCSPWLIISNTDVRLSSTDSLSTLNMIGNEGRLTPSVVAPSVISLRTGKDQNPYLQRRPSRREYRRRRLMLASPTLAQVAILGSAFRSYVSRKNRRLEDVGLRDIYAPHGSFMAIHKRYFDGGGDLDYPGFLFGEEIYIAECCWDRGLRVLYHPDIVVEHVEHGQMGLWRPRRLLKLSGVAAKYADEANAASAVTPHHSHGLHEGTVADKEGRGMSGGGA